MFIVCRSKFTEHAVPAVPSKIQNIESGSLFVVQDSTVSVIEQLAERRGGLVNSMIFVAI